MSENNSSEIYIRMLIAIVSSCLTFLFTTITWSRQKHYDKRNLAYAIYRDFYFQNELLNKMILATKEIKHLEVIQNSIYTEQDLYFTSKTEMSTLDDKLIKSLDQLYSYLFEAEKARQTTIAYSGSNGDILFKDLSNKLELAQAQLKNTQNLLREKYNFPTQDIT